MSLLHTVVGPDHVERWGRVGQLAKFAGLGSAWAAREAALTPSELPTISNCTGAPIACSTLFAACLPASAAGASGESAEKTGPTTFFAESGRDVKAAAGVFAALPRQRRPQRGR